MVTSTTNPPKQMHKNISIKTNKTKQIHYNKSIKTNPQKQIRKFRNRLKKTNQKQTNMGTLTTNP